MFAQLCLGAMAVLSKCVRVCILFRGNSVEVRGRIFWFCSGFVVMSCPVNEQPPGELKGGSFSDFVKGRGWGNLCLHYQAHMGSQGRAHLLVSKS